MTMPHDLARETTLQKVDTAAGEVLTLLRRCFAFEREVDQLRRQMEGSNKIARGWGNDYDVSRLQAERDNLRRQRDEAAQQFATTWARAESYRNERDEARTWARRLAGRLRAAQREITDVTAERDHWHRDAWQKHYLIEQRDAERCQLRAEIDLLRARLADLAETGRAAVEECGG
jgi:predicted  nucleic acid-binding Zn-ribbon protein